MTPVNAVIVLMFSWHVPGLLSPGTLFVCRTDGSLELDQVALFRSELDFCMGRSYCTANLATALQILYYCNAKSAPLQCKIRSYTHPWRWQGDKHVLRLCSSGERIANPASGGPIQPDSYYCSVFDEQTKSGDEVCRAAQPTALAYF
jgi:hypothetical protein